MRGQHLLDQFLEWHDPGLRGAEPKHAQSTKDSLELRLLDLIRSNWPQLDTITLKFRGAFAYITFITAEGQPLPLRRLRYIGYASE